VTARHLDKAAHSSEKQRNAAANIHLSQIR
jgi:hypothetical protein